MDLLIPKGSGADWNLLTSVALHCCIATLHDFQVFDFEALAGVISSHAWYFLILSYQCFKDMFT